MKVKELLIFVVASTFVSFQTVPAIDENELLLQHIAEKGETCINKVLSEERIYLNEEQIIQNEEGVFLILNERGDIIRIPELCRDGSGYFVRSFTVQSALRILNICPGCGREYLVYCRNPDCPLKKKKK